MSDVKNAVRDLEERAKQGDTKSMVKLGIYHLYGDGEVARDYQQSRKWFEQAANQGDTSSMVRLGVNYLYGINGTVSDPQQAEKWFKQAAELGSGEALMALGDFYLNGHDVERALEKAIPLFEAAAEKGFEHGAWKAASAYEELGDDAAAVEVLKQFVDNPKAHRASKADILNKLGHHYEVGKGVEQDYNTALDYHMQAGVAGSVASMLRVAELYESGAGGIKQDAEEGQRWRNTAELAKKEKEAVVTPSSLATAKQALNAFVQSDGYQVSAQDLEQRVGRTTVRPMGLG